VLEDAQLFGIEMPDQSTEPELYEVWPEHKESLLMFLRCQTQWRMGPSGATGLDYRVVLELLRLYNIKDRKAAMDEIQIMEARALELLNEQAAKDSKRRKRKR
jgi:hypothetical protein